MLSTANPPTALSVGMNIILIRKYGSTSYVGVRQIQNGILYIRYRSGSTITTAGWHKAFINEKPLLFYYESYSKSPINLSESQKYCM